MKHIKKILIAICLSVTLLGPMSWSPGGGLSLMPVEKNISM